MTPGTLAASTFLLLTGFGAVAQVLKLRSREQRWQRGEIPRAEIFSGLLPIRELWSYSAFLLFALSGLTRPYIDYYLIVSRVPVVLLTTVILFYLARHGAVGARRYLHLALIGDAVLAVFISGVVMGQIPFSSARANMIDGAVVSVGIFLVYGKLSQAREMLRTGGSAAVSWIREGGLVLKDLTGLYYASTIGSALLFVGITHALSLVSSAAICTAKYLLESKPQVDG